MKPRVILATVLNFFLPGLGYLVAGVKKAYAPLFLIGVIGLTYVETSIQALDATLYWTMFASVLVMNTGFAIDCYLEANKALGAAAVEPQRAAA